MMYLKIAIRNLLRDRKRTALIASVLLISCSFLLLSYAVGNGIGSQILRTYRNSQSGDVTVVWENVKEIDPSDPSRLFFSDFEMSRDVENREAIRRLRTFLKDHETQISRSARSIHGEGMIDTGTYAAYSLIRGITDDEYRFMQQQRLLKVVAGNAPFNRRYGILISDRTARENDIYIGDWIILDSRTVSGYMNTLEYQVTGVYHSSSEYDGVYVYMSRENALELFDQDPVYFRTLRIYLKEPEQADSFAQKLDEWLTAGGGVLRAESMEESSRFYFTIAGFQKQLFTFFVIFVYFVIAVGIRSAVRMNLFQRMREFGTLRAIGFGRLRSFLMAMLEIFVLSLVALAAALILSSALVLILNRTGIHVGGGAIAYAIGGEWIYPELAAADVLNVLLIVILFSFFAPLKPGLRLSVQGITDLLAQRSSRKAFPGLKKRKTRYHSPGRRRNGQQIEEDSRRNSI